LSGQQRIINNNDFLQEHYADLCSGDIVLGRVRFRTAEEHVLLDLVERGVVLIPSALSQLLSRSKAFQARIFSSFMLPHTTPIYDLHTLLDTVNQYGRHEIGRVITKHDRRNAGMGILLWNSIEEVYSQASLRTMPFPFVVQPFYPDSRDMRVIVLGEYLEAYWRHNQYNFRHNLHCGGESVPCTPLAEQIELCRAVMERGKFLYAHLDLLVTSAGESFLSEINLCGGMRGALLSRDEYQERIEAIHQACMEEVRQG